MNLKRTYWLALLAVGLFAASPATAQREQVWTATVDAAEYDQAVLGAARSAETVLRCDVAREIDGVTIRRDDTAGEVAIELLCLGGCPDQVIRGAEGKINSVFQLTTVFSAARDLAKYGAETTDQEEAEAVWHFYAILPGKKSRFFRSFDLKVSFLDQADKLFAGADPADPTLPLFVDNTKEDLSKFELTFNPGKVFRSPADLVGAYTLFGADGSKALLDSSADPLFCVPPEDKLSHVAWSGNYGLGRRLLNGLTLSAGISERSDFLGTTPIPEPLRGRDESEGTYAVSFDPDSLVVFPGELAAAYAALEQHVGLNKANRVRLKKMTASSGDCLDKAPIQCLQEISGVKIRGRWLAALLPKIEVKSIDQFDLVSASGSVFESLAEDSLETVTLTWDLSKALDSAKHRREAIKALASHFAIVAREKRFGRKLEVRSTAIRVPLGFPVPVQLAAGYEGELKNQSAIWKVLGDNDNTQEVSVSAAGLLETTELRTGTITAQVKACDDVSNCSPITDVAIKVF